MKKALFLLLALALVFPLVACGDGGSNTSAPPSNQPSASAPASSAPPSGVPVRPDIPEPPTGTDNPSLVVDEVRHSARNDSWDCSPWKNNGNAGQTVWFQLYSCLMANPGYGTPLEDMHYDIAESITLSADRMTATIKLRDYVRDSKGNPIRAEDVVYSYETAPTVAPTYARINNFMSSIRAVDPLTIEMKIKTAAPGTWEVLLSYTPVVSKSWYEKSSDDEKANDPATTGAYKVTENIVGVRTVLEAIDDFWQKDELRSLYQIVNVKKIIYVAILETTMRAIALENGELDSAWIDLYSARRFESDPNFNVFKFWMANPNTIVLNGSENSPFHNNPALRKAVLHAVDWAQAAIPVSGEELARGHDVAPMLCSDFDPAWNNEPYFDYNPELAKQYLIEAGYTENSGLTLRYITRSNPEQLSAATIIQSYLKVIGIDLTFEGLAQGIYDAYLTDPTQWDMNWYTQSMPNGFVTEAWIYYFGNRGSGGNASFINDPQMQALLEEAIVKNDAASKNAFRAYAIDQAFAANVSNEPVYYVARKGIETYPVNFLINPALNAAIYTPDF